jgi:hypothetical protein
MTAQTSVHKVSRDFLLFAPAKMIDAALRLGNNACMDLHGISVLLCGLQHSFFRNWFRYDLHRFLLVDLSLKFIRG